MSKTSCFTVFFEGHLCACYLKQWLEARSLRTRPQKRVTMIMAGAFHNWSNHQNQALLGEELIRMEETHVLGNNSWRQNSCFMARRVERLQKINLNYERLGPPTEKEKKTTSKIGQKYTTNTEKKSYFWLCLTDFKPISRVAVFSCPVGFQGFPEARACFSMGPHLGGHFGPPQKKNTPPPYTRETIHAPSTKGLLMVVSKRWFEFFGERNSTTPFLPQFCPLFTSILPIFNLFLASAQPAISNHGLETTVYRLLVRAMPCWGPYVNMRWLEPSSAGKCRGPKKEGRSRRAPKCAKQVLGVPPMPSPWGGAILKGEKKPSLPVRERQFGRHFKR